MKNTYNIYKTITRLWRRPLQGLALLAVMLAALTGCHSNDEPKTITPPVPETAKRTVLVYMVATNNLGTGGFDTSDINEMCRLARDGGLADSHLVLYHASSKGVVLKEVTATGIDTLKVYDNSALNVSAERMRQVIADTKELAPARDYGLVLWSHASGWLQDGVESRTPVAYSYGSDGMSNPKRMNITTLADATADAGFSFVYFDCCYMGSVEVMYEMRHTAPYLIASPTEDPAPGMPYDLTLPHLLDTSVPLEDACVRAARTTFDYYNDKFKTGDCPCTMTVVRTDRLEPLARATAALYTGATTTYNYEYDYQRFETGLTCWYFDLDEYVESVAPDADELTLWRQALDEAVVYHDATPYVWSSFPINRCCGLSTYILRTKDNITDKGYNTTSWYTDVACHLFD